MRTGRRMRAVVGAVALFVAMGVLAGPALAQTGTITTVAGGGPGNVPAVEASLRGNTKIAADSAGNLYVSDVDAHRVYKVDASTGRIATFAGNGFPGNSGDGGPATQAQLSTPYGLALDEPRGILYVADPGSAVIRAVDLSAGTISTVAGSGVCGYSGVGGPATAAQICDIGPEIAVGPDGAVYFSVREFPPTAIGRYRILAVRGGVLERIAGNGVGRGSIDGQGGNLADDYLESVSALESSLGTVIAIAVGDADLYFYENELRIRRIHLATGELTTYAGNGYSVGQIDGPGGDPRDDLIDGTPGLQSPLEMIRGLAMLPGGDLAATLEWAGRIIRISPSAGVLAGPVATVAGGGSQLPLGVLPLSASFSDPMALSASGGSLFVAAHSYRDFAGHGVYRVTTDDVRPLVGNGYGSYCGDGGPSADSCVRAPSAARPDGAGNLLIADANLTIRAVDAAGVIRSSSPYGSLAETPVDLLPTSSGEILLSFADSSTVVRPDAGSAAAVRFAGNGTVTGSIDGEGGDPTDDLGDGAQALAASLNMPAGLARDAQGNTFIADSGNHRVRRVDAVTGVIRTVAGNGQPASTGDGGPATDASLNEPWALAFEANGDLLVSERSGHRVRRIAAGADGLVTGGPADEVVTTIAGGGQPGYSGDGGAAVDAGLALPVGLAVDPAGNVYVAESGSHAIRRIDGQDGTITTIAGRGLKGDGLAVDSLLATPVGLSIGTVGGRVLLYVADRDDNRVRAIDVGPVGVSGGNQPPVADAGADRLAFATSPDGALVSLYADASDPDGDPLTYEWTGPFGSVALAVADVRLPIGVNTVTLTVDDGNGHVVSDDVAITVSGVNTLSGGGTVTPPDDGASRKVGATPGRITASFLGSVTTPGLTWLRTRTDQLPPPPAGKQLGSAPFYYDVATTAVADGDVRLCFDLTGMSFSSPAQVRLHHLVGTWQDTGVAPDAATHEACVVAPFASVFGTYAAFTPADERTRVATIAGTGPAGDAGDGGPATAARLNQPTAVALDAVRGLLYVGENAGSRVRRVNLGTGVIDTIAGTGDFQADPTDGVDAKLSSMGSVQALAVDAQGNLFLADQSHCLIRRVDAATNFITTVAGAWRGPGVSCGDPVEGAPAASTAIAIATSLAIDAQGNLLFADQSPLAGLTVAHLRRISAGADHLVKADADDLLTTVGGDGTQGPPPEGSAPLSSGMLPTTVAFAADGSLYVASVDRILRITPGGDGVVDGSTDEAVSTVLGASAGYSLPFQGDGAPARAAYFGVPRGLAVLPSGDLLVGEPSFGRIRRITAGADHVVNGGSDETVSTVAGFTDDAGFPPSYNGDGYALSTRLGTPWALAADELGDAIVAEANGQRVRRFGLPLPAPLSDPADLSIDAVTATPTPVDLDATLTFAVTVTNAGPGVAHGVSVAFDLPAAIGVIDSAPGACVAPPEGTAGTVTCALGDLPAGGTTGLQVQARPVSIGTWDIPFTVSSEDPDPAVSNNAVVRTVESQLGVIVLEVPEVVTVTDTVDVNVPPVAFNVDVATTMDVAVLVNLAATDGDGDPLTFAVVSPPGHGSVSAVSGNQVTYTPGPGFIGTDTFTFEATDGQLSASATATITVEPPASATTLTSAPNPSVGGLSVTFTANVSSPAGVPGGSVTFECRLASAPALPCPLGTVPLDATAGAHLSTASLPVGTVTVFARYSGSPLYAASEASLVQQVTAAPTSTTLTSSFPTSLTTRPPVFTATIDRGGAPWPATGTVEFFADGASLGRAPVFDRGGATIAVMGGATLTAGTHQITAVYGGDASYGSSAAGALTQVVAPGDYYVADLTPASTDPAEATAVNGDDLVAGFSSHVDPRNGFSTTLGFVFRGGLSPLGGLGGSVTAPAAVNDAGQVVGLSTNATAAARAFSFQAGTIVELGTLGGPTSRARAVNASGLVVGLADTAGGEAHAFRFEGGSMLDLGTLGGALSDAVAVNASGVAAGHATLADGTVHAARFTTLAIDLGTLGGTSSRAVAINDAGQVAGLSDLAGDADLHAFLWQDGRLTDLVGTAGPSSAAVDVNDAGQVAGHTVVLSGIGASHATDPTPKTAFLYRAGVLTELGALAGGRSRAFDLSNSGLVVGASDGHAFVSNGGALRDLGTLGGATSRAVAVSDRGLIVGAADTAAGVAHAVAWVPVPVPTLVVEPSSGPVGGTATLSATLTLFGAPLANQSVAFALNGVPVGIAATDATGSAMLAAVSLAGLAPGAYPGAISVTFVATNVLGGASASGRLTVVAAPVAVDDAYETVQDAALAIAAPGVLGNDANVGAGTAALVSGPSHGTLDLRADGSSLYTPASGYVGADSFAYRVEVGGVSSGAATVALTVRSALILPIDRGLVNSPRVTVDDRPGDQTDPHVDGDVVSYTDSSSAAARIAYYRFSTGDRRFIPAVDPNDKDVMADVQGDRIVFSRVQLNGTASSWLYDIGTQSPTNLAPQAGSSRFVSVIGGSAVVFEETALGNGDILAVSLPGASLETVAATPDIDQNPRVSPDGRLAVWERCVGSQCATWKASRTEAGWSSAVQVSPIGLEAESGDTDGTFVVFDGHPIGSWSPNELYIAPIAGGSAARLSLPGRALRNPHVDGGVVSFEATPSGGLADVFVYVIATKELLRVTDTPSGDETLSYVSVLPNGDIRVVWASDDGPLLERNVYATTILRGPDTVPPAVALVTPVGGERVFTGTSYVVSWTATDDRGVAAVDVELSTDGGASFAPLAGCTGLPGTASRCTWSAPGPLTTQGRIRVTARDAAGNAGRSVSAASFSIVAGSPSVTLSAPVTAVTWRAGNTQAIRFNHTLGVGQKVAIELSRDGGASWTALSPAFVTTSATSGVLNWTVTAPATTQARARVRWTGNDAVSSASPVDFTILDRLTLTSPTAASGWTTGSTRNIIWTHNLGLAETVHVDLSRDGSATWTRLASDVPNTAATTGTFPWVVTEPATTRARIRLVRVADPSVVSTSPPFTISGTVRVSALAGAASWAIGSRRTIAWTHTLGAGQAFDLDLSTDGGATYSVPVARGVAAPAGSGSYDWVVAGPVGASARLRVSWSSSAAVQGASGTFAMAAPALTLDQPKAGASWAIGTTRQLAWTHNLGTRETVDVEESTDGGKTWLVLASGVANAAVRQGTYDWPVAGPATTEARLRVRWSKDGSVVGAIAGNLTIAPPFVRVTSPNTNVSWAIGTVHNVTFAHNLGAGQAVALELTRDGGATWSPLATVTTVSATSGTYAWTVSGPPLSTAKVRATWLASPAVTDESDRTFRIQ